MKLTHKRLLEVLRYNKSTGLFTWHVTPEKASREYRRAKRELYA